MSDFIDLKSGKARSYKFENPVVSTPSIKFSHAYHKLMVNGHVCRKAMLLQVLSVTLDQLSKEFIDYDTDNGKYKLKHDTLWLMLIFQKEDGHIFTTLRQQFSNYGHNKEAYFQSLIGKEFEVIILPGKEATNG